MSDRVRMTSKTVFQNDRVTVFREGGPAEGEKGEAATVGVEFETDLTHAKELDRLGLAVPKNRADLDGEATPLEPHHQVSVPDLLADRSAREAAPLNAPAAEASELSSSSQTTQPAATTDVGGAAASDGPVADAETDPGVLTSTRRRNASSRTA